MQRLRLPERPDWKAKAEQQGFTFSEMYGEPYWDESSAYAFSLRQIEEDIEDPSTELHQMCRVAVDHVLGSEELMEKLALPRPHWDFIAQSWKANEPELYGRMDLAYSGKGPAKLLEYNADTPTSLYESAVFQWQWLEDQRAANVLPQGADQFNRIHEALAERFAEICAPGSDVHFAAVGGLVEDYATVETMAYAAREAGLGAHYTDMEKIGLTEEGQFADSQDRVIGTLFKLYPWEDMLRDTFAAHLTTAHCRFIEPPWKAILSNKGILPVLWKLFPGHPNLLPAFFEKDITEISRNLHLMTQGHVLKPLFSREGASITIVELGQVTHQSENRAYDTHPRILQAYHPLPQMGGMYPVIGSWIVGQACVGMGLREDPGRVTQDLSRFKPHFIEE